MPKKSWSRGAKKAFAAMTAPPSKGGYGRKKGEAIFYAKANKVAGGKGTLNQRASSAYKKGGSQKPKKR